MTELWTYMYSESMLRYAHLAIRPFYGMRQTDGQTSVDETFCSRLADGHRTTITEIIESF